MPAPEKSPDEFPRTPLTAKQRLDNARSLARLTLFFLRDAGIKTTVDLFREPDYLRGLTEGSIIANPLWYPLHPGILMSKTTGAGHWVGADPRRPKIFPARKGKPAPAQFFQGALSSALLDEIKDNPPEQRTPDRLVNLLRFEHRAAWNRTTVEQAIGDGLLRQTTYGDAFDRLGWSERFGESLEARGLYDDTVFQVTPKGNTLVYLLGGSDEPEPQQNAKPSFANPPGLSIA